MEVLLPSNLMYKHAGNAGALKTHHTQCEYMYSGRSLYMDFSYRTALIIQSIKFNDIHNVLMIFTRPLLLDSLIYRHLD